MSLPNFPFTAVCGQDQLKLVLILLAINPQIGGALIMGPRGSAKSTLARGLTDILPDSDHPFVTLPLNTSEEMLVGTLNLEQVLNERAVSFQPGLLAKAHQGVLYVDEVNLLNDTLVDLLLDVAASGVNYVERDGVSHQHSSRFVLLGTMNPDEGELRPQLLDRFGLAVELSATPSIEDRVAIVKRRQQYDANAENFLKLFADQQQELKNTIKQARDLLAQVRCDDSVHEQIARRCVAARVDGVRADIVWFRAALAHAALFGRVNVSLADVAAVEEFVLCHRRQMQPPQNPSSPPFQRPQPQYSTSSGNEAGGGVTSAYQAPESGTDTNREAGTGDWGSMQPQQLAASDQTYAVNVAKLNPSSAKNPSTIGTKRRGREVTCKQGIHWQRTLVRNYGRWPLSNLVQKEFRVRVPRLHVVLLDASASMLGKQWFAQAKAIVRAIAAKAYFEREYLMLLGFGDGQVSTHVSKRRAPKELVRLLAELTAGGGTPLRSVLQTAKMNAQRYLQQTPGSEQKFYLITDGRTRQNVADMMLPGQTWVIDMESEGVRRGRSSQIAQQLNAHYLAASELLS